jgi:hypothetical protein
MTQHRLHCSGYVCLISMKTRQLKPSSALWTRTFDIRRSRIAKRKSSPLFGTLAVCAITLRSRMPGARPSNSLQSGKTVRAYIPCTLRSSAGKAKCARASLRWAPPLTLPSHVGAPRRPAGFLARCVARRTKLPAVQFRTSAIFRSRFC